MMHDAATQGAGAGRDDPQEGRLTGSFTVSFAEIGRADLALVGGKGANLGELTALGSAVPAGFCITTHAYRAFTATCEGHKQLLGELARVEPADTPGLRRLGSLIRRQLRSLPVPAEIAAAIRSGYGALGPEVAVAVRSSATAEDLPEASFAGQHDTYLNVVGSAAVLDRVRSCWASLFTDRAIVYRSQRGIDHREVALGVVVQRLVAADRSAIMFTADPASGHRGQVTVDAGFGLGEALVSGLINADFYRLDKRTGAVLQARPGEKACAIVPVAGGGTERLELDTAQRRARVLDDAELRQLLRAGSRLEAHYGAPQDIELCFEGPKLYLVQARPITTLYPPLEPACDDGSLHVHLSLGHVQMMTDAMRPLGRSALRYTLPLGRPMDVVRPSPWIRSAGGRLYLDLSQILRRALPRRGLLRFLTVVDERASQAIAQVVARPEFARGPKVPLLKLLRFGLPKGAQVLSALWLRRPEGTVDRLNRWLDDWYAASRAAVAAQSSVADRFHLALGILARIFPKVFRIPPLILAAVIAAGLIRKLSGATDAEMAALSRAFTGNVTTDMDLEVGDLTDIARRHPELAAALSAGVCEREALAEVAGGPELLGALDAFLQRYGVRGSSEIDITRPRWRDDPSLLLRVVAGGLAEGEPGRHRRRHAALGRQAEQTARELIARTRRRPWGFFKAWLLRRLIRVYRNLAPVREHPKLQLMRHFALLRDACLAAGGALAAQGRLAAPEDVLFLHLDEIGRALDGDEPVGGLKPLVAERQADFRRCQGLTPPLVLTSDNEIPSVQHARADLPPGALAGSPVSAGIVEGVAHVVLDPTAEVLRAGEVLIAPNTDPGWTPLFINAAALVTEVGGLMTHGSVVAREHGIPAVASVPSATKLIRTGQRVRVNGDGGWVEILEDAP